MEDNILDQEQQTLVQDDCSKNSVRPKYYKQIYRTAWEDMPEFKG